MDYIYTLEGVNCFYGDRRALSVDRLNIKAGETLGLIGPNGSGKSTLLKVLAFLLPHQGRLEFGGTAGQERLEVTLLLQEPFLLRRSVYENIAYGLKLRGWNADCDRRIQESLDMVGLPRAFAKRFWHELSGGEAQRVALASRLALRPKVLLLDEPVASVDEQSAARIITAIQTAKKEWRTTLVVAAHDLTWIEKVADDVVTLVNGNIIGHGVMNLLNEGNSGSTLSDSIDFKGKTAALSPSDIVFHFSEYHLHKNDIYVECLVLQTSLEKNTNTLLVTLACGECVLKGRIALLDNNCRNLTPGTTIDASFSSSAIRWL